MKNESVVLIFEPDRIIGWDIQLELEGKGHTVFQVHTLKQIEGFKNKEQVKFIIIDIDNVKMTDFIGVRNLFTSSPFFIIGISSGKKGIEKYEEVKFTETFLKPFDTKKIATFIDDNCVATEPK